MAFEDRRLPIRQRAHAGGFIPRCGRTLLFVARSCERYNWSVRLCVGWQRRGFACFPDRDSSVFAGGDEARVRHRGHGIHRAVVEAQNGHGRACLDVPDDRRLIEAAGNRRGAIRRDRERPHRAAVPAEHVLSGVRRRQNRRKKRCGDQQGKSLEATVSKHWEILPFAVYRRLRISLGRCSEDSTRKADARTLAFQPSQLQKSVKRRMHGLDVVATLRTRRRSNSSTIGQGFAGGDLSFASYTLGRWLSPGRNDRRSGTNSRRTARKTPRSKRLYR